METIYLTIIWSSRVHNVITLEFHRLSELVDHWTRLVTTQRKAHNWGKGYNRNNTGSRGTQQTSWSNIDLSILHSKLDKHWSRCTAELGNTVSRFMGPFGLDDLGYFEVLSWSTSSVEILRRAVFPAEINTYRMFVTTCITKTSVPSLRYLAPASWRLSQQSRPPTRFSQIAGYLRCKRSQASLIH